MEAASKQQFENGYFIHLARGRGSIDMHVCLLHETTTTRIDGGELHLLLLLRSKGNRLYRSLAINRIADETTKKYKD